MSLITEAWRLKLLALGLAVLMLGAVAFSQNPPTTKTMTVGIIYASVPSGLILINPPKQTTVTITGLADLVSAANSANTAATADISKATVGPSVKVNLVGKTLIGNIAVTTAPIALNIDARNMLQLGVIARTPKGPASGWQITKQETQCLGPPPPCTVTFDGPAGWEKNLKAYADYPFQVVGSPIDFPSVPVALEQNGTVLDTTTYTVPKAGLDISTVSIHIEAKSGTTSRQVTLIDAPPANPPPNCYRVTGISVDPLSIVATGTADVLANITTITLPAVDLSQHTSNFTFRIAIPFPTGVTGSTSTARVTYTIAQNPSCATPSP